MNWQMNPLAAACGKGAQRLARFGKFSCCKTNIDKGFAALTQSERRDQAPRQISRFAKDPTLHGTSVEEFDGHSQV
jgi:hypothetical protein